MARQLVFGVLDAQLAESSTPEALPEVQFAYDGDVFRSFGVKTYSKDGEIVIRF